MPGLMGRASVIVRAKFSKLLDRAEDPGETLDYSYEEQLRQLQNVKRGIADVTTAKKRLELQYTSMQQQADKLDGQARTALEQNREDAATAAPREDYAASGDDIDRQPAQLSQGSPVDDELAKMKAEIGQGDAAPKPELESGEAKQ